jgi:hypothetical protein
VGGDVGGAGDLDPPPDVVEELERRERRLGELLVESPGVLGVLAAQPAGDQRQRVADPIRQRPGGALGGLERVETVLDPEPQAAEEVRDRLRLCRVDPGRGVHLPLPGTRDPRRSAIAPGWIEGPIRRPVSFAAKSRIAEAASWTGSNPTSSRRRRLSTPRP